MEFNNDTCSPGVDTSTPIPLYVTDDNTPWTDVVVTIVWDSAEFGSGSQRMNGTGPHWTFTFGPYEFGATSNGGKITYHVTATDGLGQTTEFGPNTITVQACPIVG
jgi:hypothetical protein